MLARSLSVFAVLLFLSVAASSAIADGAYGTTAVLTGSRSVGLGLVTGESDWLDAVITWSIVDNGDSTWTYTYTFTGFNKPTISHFTLDLTDDAVDGDSFADPNAVTQARLNGELILDYLIEPGNHDGIIGVKFGAAADDETAVYSFISNRNPVYGDIYVKGGQSSLVNAGYYDHASQSELDFIARPNGVFPEPATLATLAIGSLAVLSRRRKS